MKKLHVSLENLLAKGEKTLQDLLLLSSEPFQCGESSETMLLLSYHSSH